MTAGSSRAAIAAAVVFAVVAARPFERGAAAQPSSQAVAATAQFDKGRALMKEKKYDEACAAFESSQKLDPQWGTLYNLATCYGVSGKLASAWAAYRELAQRDTNPARRKESARRAKALDERLPRLLVKVTGAPAGLNVTLDGTDVTALVGTDSPVDLGPHKIHASAPRYQDFDTQSRITDEGKTVTVAIDLVPVAEPRRAAPPEPVAATRPRPGEPRPVAPVQPRTAPAAPADSGEAAARSHRRTYGIIVAGAGGALVATGLVFGRIASSKWSDAKALCGDDRTCDNQVDLAAGNQLVSDARSAANVSTALVIGGAAAIGVGAVLFITAQGTRTPGDVRAQAWRLAPTVRPSAFGLVLDGRF